MKVDFFPFTDINYLSKRDIKFQTEPELFQEFLNFPFTLEGFKDKIEDRKNYPVNRQVLVDVLHKQYSHANITDAPVSQIDKLIKENVFTVVTAHQPSLLTGPLYFIYKIISVINLAEKLSLDNPGTEVLPVFIVGSEDHDFEEINHLNLFNKKIEWLNDENGAVGRMSTSTIYPVLEEIYQILGSSDKAAELKEIISNAFSGIEVYNIAVLRLVHELFKKFGLICLIADDARLKNEFKHHIKKEIFEQASQGIIQETQEALEKMDMKSQAFARDINFFYLQSGRRDRIILEDDLYKILDTSLTFTKDELEKEIDLHPEKFSPNVVMRPIYQETILPNLAYLGGGGEIAYWTERKKQFQHFDVSFPILVRRNSVLWISQSDIKQLQKYNISIEDIFSSEEDWIKDFIKENANASLEFSKEYELFHNAFELLEKKAELIDNSLAQAIKGSHVKEFKVFEQLSGRLLRAEKDRYEKDVQKIRKIKDKLFPGMGLQERADNFMPYYLKHGQAYFDILKDHLDPFNHSFVVISEV